MIKGNGINGTRKAVSRNDEYYTHVYAIEPILKYLKPNQIIWCPFSTKDSNFVKLLRENNHTVIHTHIDTGDDFFNTIKKCDIIIDNPPYTIKNDVLTRLFKLKIPFMMLLNAAGLFDGQYRFNLFNKNKFELMIMDKRIEYFTDYNKPQKSTKKSPPNPSIYFCSNVLPNQIVFEKILSKYDIPKLKTPELIKDDIVNDKLICDICGVDYTGIIFNDHIKRPFHIDSLPVVS